MAYFKYFPVIIYNNNPVRNILARVNFKENLKKYLSVLLNYTVTESDRRADIISFNYYDDAYKDWLLFLSNDIIDPYFDYPLEDFNFENYIISKYGSIEAAINTIKFYRNDWASDDSEKSVDSYAYLTAGQKKYWEPYTFDMITNLPAVYVRKKEDLTITTNKIATVAISNVSSSNTYVGEKVTIANSSYSVTGVVDFSNSSSVLIKHIVNDPTVIDYTFTMTSNSSSITANVSSGTVLKDVIPSDEVTYWTAVSVYDYESELNTEKKNLYLVDKRQAQVLEENLKKVLR